MRFPMKSIYAAFCAAAFLCCSVNDAHAQFTTKWLAHGKFAHIYSESGARAEETVGLSWPIQILNSHNIRAKTVWTAVENFKDETGKTWVAKVSHVGPRVNGQGEAFPEAFETINRFEPPEVTVDGFVSFNKVLWPAEQNVRLDESLIADGAIYSKVSFITGITMEMTAYAFANEYHDNYQIQEYTFTNTGNVDADTEPELNQTLNGVYFYFNSRYAPGAEGAAWTNGGGQMWGNATMADATWDGNPNYNVDFRSHFAWYGRSGGQANWNTIGGPIINNVSPWAAASDTVGRLGAALHVGKVILHADGAAHEAGVSMPDDPKQPMTMDHYNADGPLVDGNATHLNESRNVQELNEIIKAGRVLPTQARAVAPDGDFTHQTVDPSNVDGSSSVGEGFGPYTMAPGQQVKIVTAEGVAGLNEKIALEVGRAYKRSGRNDELKIPYTINGTEVSLTKNEWVLSTRDSIFQMFGKAIANYKSGYKIPRPPLPPRRLTVVGIGDKISLTWEVYPNADHLGFEIYRASNRVDSVSYRLIATLPAGARSFDDKTAVRGTNYFYYVQSVGPVNNDPTGSTPTGVALKSNRFYTQTYDPASLKRQAGTSLSAVRVVPNPYSISQQEEVVRFAEQDRIAFLDIPGECTIKIYTESGELIKTIEHTNGTGDEFWQLTTESNQVVATGVYIAYVRDKKTSQSVIRKFVIVR